MYIFIEFINDYLKVLRTTFLLSLLNFIFTNRKLELDGSDAVAKHSATLGLPFSLIVITHTRTAVPFGMHRLHAPPRTVSLLNEFLVAPLALGDDGLCLFNDGPCFAL